MDKETKEYYLAANINSLTWQISLEGIPFKNKLSTFEFYILNINLASAILYWSPISQNPIAKSAAPILFKLMKKQLINCNLSTIIDIDKWYNERCKFYSNKLKTGINSNDDFLNIFSRIIEYPMELSNKYSTDVGAMYLFSIKLKEHLNDFTDAIQQLTDAILNEN